MKIRRGLGAVALAAAFAAASVIASRITPDLGVVLRSVASLIALVGFAVIAVSLLGSEPQRNESSGE